LAIAPILFFQLTDPSNVHPLFFPLLFGAYTMGLLVYWGYLRWRHTRQLSLWQYGAQVLVATVLFCGVWALGIFVATHLTLALLVQAGYQAMLYIRTSGQQFTDITVSSLLFLALCFTPAAITNVVLALALRCWL
jgi:hypothetical protein